MSFRHKKRSSGNKSKSESDKSKQAGTYKTKEEVEKPPKMDHPCNLTRTTVRISFPELKGEVFVNLLGYKEPNLIPLWRCKGRRQLGPLTAKYIFSKLKNPFNLSQSKC